MFEILLQADQALAGGDLDQAEQAYWQLVEIDGSNTIAMAGLAQVAFQRGDKRLARAFAERALKVDPDSVSARKIMAALEGRETGSAADEAGLRAQVASLEALGKRKRSTRGEADGSAAAGGAAAGEADAGEAKAADRAEAEAADNAWAAEAARMEQEAIRAAEARAAEVLAALAQEEAEARAAEAEAVVEAADEEERPAPAAKATAEAAGRAARPGRAVDPFSEAESAATIEAIDAAEDVAEEEQAPAVRAGRTQAEMGDSERQLAAAERESAALAADTAPSRVSGAAEAAGRAAEAAGRAAGTAAGSTRRPGKGRFPAASPTSDDLDDELPDAVDTDEETSGRPIPIEAGAFGPDGTSEENAEAAAMREAMDMIARGESGKPGSGETVKPDEGEPDQVDEGETPPRKGLFRRLRGG